MPSEAAASAVDWPVHAYVGPIQSVLFVDDQFPTYAEPESGDEKERARDLWKACHARGWLCDVDNSIDWTSHQQRGRLASSDLIVLDYQLSGDDPTPALRVIQHLASCPTPNLVVVYTAADNLDSVLLRLAAFARGVSAGACAMALPDDIADMEGAIDWSTGAFLSRLSGKDGWKREFFEACRAANPPVAGCVESGASLVERALKSQFDPPVVEEIKNVDAIGLEGGRLWFQSGNLFVAVVGKPKEGSSRDEADTLFDGLEASIRAWNPSWLACLIARSRHESNEGAFRDDLALPNENLQKGLIRYVASAVDHEEKLRRSRYVASDLLRRRFDAATALMGDHILRSLPQEAADADEPCDTDAVLHVNAFLCAERHDRHHLRVGTVFRSEPGDQYWVCVTPACDMVPRPRNASIDPWGASLGDTRALTAIRLDANVDKRTAVTKAEEGRYVFFDDYSEPSPAPKAAVVFNLSTNDPNPKIEQMFAKDLARVADGKVIVQRIVCEDGVVSLQDQPCVVVCQLRAPYAERLAHIVGGHMSRIGVDFLSGRRRRQG